MQLQEPNPQTTHCQTGFAAVRLKRVNAIQQGQFYKADTDGKPIPTTPQKPPPPGTSSSKQLTQELNHTLWRTALPIANLSSLSLTIFPLLWLLTAHKRANLELFRQLTVMRKRNIKSNLHFCD